MRTPRTSLLAATLAALACLSCDAGNPAGCSANADCTDKAHPVCDPKTGTCGGCGTSADCPADQICLGGACMPGCDEQHACPNGQQCDPKTHGCLPCVNDQGCAKDKHCDPKSHMCVGCIDDSQCQNGQHCDPKSQMCLDCLGDPHCPNGQCDLSTHSCVGCTDDKACGGMTPHCLKVEHRCVQCLQGADDCPAGSACGPDFLCHRGCKSDADCPGGKCLPDHSCAPCTKDDQCAQGKVCDAGTCVAACAQNNDCPNSGLCCAQHCKKPASDPANCGACGNVCGVGTGCCGGACANLSMVANCGACGNVCAKGDFCDGKACQKPTYPNFCNNKQVYVVYTQIKVDDMAADLMASTITATCPMGVVVSTGKQTDPKLVNQATGEPLAGGGVTYVLAGGPFANTVVKWLESVAKLTPIYFEADGINYLWKRRANATVAAQMPGKDCTTHHDQFITELVANPNNGTLSLIGYGACPGSLGTKTAAWHYANVLLPDRMKYPDSWYVFDWTDTDNDGGPSKGDAFKILASGK